jgi:hypothetical protein
VAYHTEVNTSAQALAHERINSALNEIIKSGRIISPYEVYQELRKWNGGDKEWAKENKNIFRHPTKPEVDALVEIVGTLPDVATVNKPYDADPWVGAFALAYKGLNNGEGCIVSEDKKAVVHIARVFSLKTPINFFDFLVNEGIVTIP